jgi:formyl-CoA transferase
VGDIASALDRATEYGLAPTISVGSTRQVRHAVRYASARLPVPTPPPALGEHDELVRTWLAGPPDAPLTQ